LILFYSGVSTAIAAMRIVATVFHERGIEIEQSEKCQTNDVELLNADVTSLFQSRHEILGPFPQEFQKLFMQMMYRIARERSTLTRKDRELVALAIAIAHGSQLAAVRLHLKTCPYAGAAAQRTDRDLEDIQSARLPVRLRGVTLEVEG
jgi:4-carboxymuconolactone decarboxylase